MSLLALLALGLGFLTTVVGSFLFAWLPYYLKDDLGLSFAQSRALLLTTALLRNCIGAAAFTLLLFALFTDRSRMGVAPQLSQEPEDFESPDVREVERTNPRCSRRGRPVTI